MPTVGELREMLAKERASWDVHPTLVDNDELPQYATGGTSEGLVPADTAPGINFSELLLAEPGNPYLLVRRVAHGFVPAQELRTLNIAADLIATEAPPAGAPPASLDWRQRWGWPWITAIRDQNGCNACWAFAATALVEAMTRIEHAVWCVRSEGDVHKGMGAICASLGSSAAALDWMRDHGGLADPACFPWTTANIPYTPSPDRSGRTVRVPSYSAVGSIADQKTWLDTVGPLVTWFDVWADFSSVGTGVYHKQKYLANGQLNFERGGHFMLVIGYDDTNACWLVKNSWGTGWGNGGYGRIGYGECGIDTYAKIGLRGTNPDPWTKRRLRNGCAFESGNGALHRNFEAAIPITNRAVQHWWRDGSDFTWHPGPAFGNDAAAFPTFAATTYNRNMELIYTTVTRRLHHWFYSYDSASWCDGGVFGPPDADGVLGFIQSDYGTPGNFEVVVRTTDGRLNHWWRQNAPPWTWSDGGRFADHVAYGGATLLQSSYGGDHKNFELVCVLNTGQMQHWWKDNTAGVWHPGPVFGAGVASPPCMIEGQFGAYNETRPGNFELCVAVGGAVQHWWRDNYGGSGWKHSATFGSHLKSVVALIEGSFGFDLEVLVLRDDNALQHYWRDGGGWKVGPVFGHAY
jgi:hypothetical protein